MNLLSKLNWRVQKWVIFAALVAGLLAGCAGVTPPVQVPVVGNHECIPASDLPAHMVMKKVPTTEAGVNELYNMLLDERASHAKDQESYNSLHGACVK